MHQHDTDSQLRTDIQLRVERDARAKRYPGSDCRAVAHPDCHRRKRSA